MAVITSSTFSQFCCRLCLLGILGLSCWMLLSALNQPVDDQQEQQQLAAAGSRQQLLPPSSGGRYRGQPLAELWAEGLPEQTWFTDQECRHLVTRFTKDDSLEVVRLVSFPRSGNTWTRYLLETATGVFTSSGGPNYVNWVKHHNWRLTNKQFWQYAKSQKAVELTQLGYLGEIGYFSQGNTIAMKSHNRPAPWSASDAAAEPYNWAVFDEDKPRRVVLVIRDPFKALISLKAYEQTHSVLTAGNDLSSLFTGQKWEDDARYYGQHWYQLNSEWIERTNDTHVLSYECLTRDTMPELRDLLKFMEVEPDEARLECVRRNLEGAVHNKKHGVVPTREIFPTWLRAQLWAEIHQLNMDLKGRGLRTLPLEKYSFADEFLDIGLEDDTAQ